MDQNPSSDARQGRPSPGTLGAKDRSPHRTLPSVPGGVGVHEGFPFAPHYSEAPGFRMHYADEGPRGGEAVLCLHGEPTCGYLFRQLIPVLSDSRRVVVPDHMGFGKSAYLANRSHWLQNHHIHPVLDDLFDFEEVPKAYDHLKSGQHFGKVVVTY